MRRFVATCALLLIAAPAAAHDFWIAPSTFHPERGRTVDVGLRVGEQFIGEPVGRDRTRLARFVLVHAGAEIPIPGQEGVDPAGRVTLTRPGLHILGYRSHRAALELGPAEFERYLESEGLETIVALRERRGERERPGREVYSRCAKSLVIVGGDAGEELDRAIGMPLELVAQSDPSALGPEGELRLRLLFLGRPLAGALIVALPEDELAPAISARTDGSGEALLRLGRLGVWLVKSVHMVPAPQGVDADWESYWASLTFEAGRR